MTKQFLSLLSIMSAFALTSPVAAQNYSQSGQENCTTVTPEVVRCDQQPSPFQQQYSAPQSTQQPYSQPYQQQLYAPQPQPWQQAMPQGFGPSTTCTTDGMGVVR